MSETRSESVQFLYYSMKPVWMAAGGCEEEAHYIADAIRFAHKQGSEAVEVFTSHWDPFFVNIAGRYALSEDQLRADFNAAEVV
jgi:hypothetical protein